MGKSLVREIMGCGPVALTDREIQVAEGVLRGKRDKEMADELGVAVGTVSHYLRSLFLKLRVDNRTKLAMVYDRLKQSGKLRGKGGRKRLPDGFRGGSRGLAGQKPESGGHVAPQGSAPEEQA